MALGPGFQSPGTCRGAGPWLGRWPPPLAEGWGSVGWQECRAAGWLEGKLQSDYPGPLAGVVVHSMALSQWNILPSSLISTGGRVVVSVALGKPKLTQACRG